MVDMMSINMKTVLVIFSCMLTAIVLAETPPGKVRLQHSLPGKLKPIKLGTIQVGGEIGRRIDLTINKNLFALNYRKDFLDPFRKPMSCPANREERKTYHKTGRMLFNGLGETIDAAVYFAAYNGDKQIIDLKDRLISAAIETQREDGYIGQFIQAKQNLQLFEGFGAEDAAFLCLAFANDARFFGSTKSLSAAKKLMACFMTAYRNYGHEKGYNYSAISFCEAALVLYQLTGDKKYLDISRHTILGPERTSQAASLLEWVNDPPFDRGWHDLRKKNEPVGSAKAKKREKRLIWHVYRHLERMTTQGKLNRIVPDKRYLQMTRLIRARLTQPEKSGMSITGGIGSHEGWSNDQDWHGHSETCASTYSLSFFEEIMNADADLGDGDLMERVIFNALFAAQHPAGRKLRYFTPFSGKREYYKTDIFCCPGNFRRGISRLPLQVLYHFKGGIAINLYTPCQATLSLPGGAKVTFTQKTRYPTDGNITIIISPEKPVRFPVYLRLPRWCNAPVLKVNGTRFKTPVINREWRAGDTITVSLPMEWRWVNGRDKHAGRYALMRGPIVYCLSREHNKLPDRMTLRNITLDPASITDPKPDRRVRPDGLCCHIKGWSPGNAKKNKAPDLKMTLTEFPDPSGEEVYFRLSQPDHAVEDELFIQPYPGSK